jgi:competence protein ComEC
MSTAVARAEAAARAAVADALDRLHEHPRHLVLGSFVAGLLANRLEPSAIVLLALAAAALAGRAGVAAFAVAAVLAGALGGQARLAALDRSVLRPLRGATVVAEAVMLEQPRPVQHGATVLVELRGLAVAGGGGAAPPAAGEAEGRVSPPAAGAGGVQRAGAGSPVLPNGTVLALVPRAAGERVMVRVRTATPWPAVATGAIVRLRGRMRPLGPFEQHYARKGAHAAVSLDAAEATGHRRGGVWRLVDDVRGRAEVALARGLAKPQAALLRGMVLGQDEALDDRARDEFRASGLSHILAASGQNVALLLALALPLLTLAGIGLRPRLTVALGLIALYVPLAGGGPSIQRAGVMGAATTVAALAGRPASRWYALLLAAAATLLLNPRASGDPGWQLSFAAVVAIALATAALSARLRRRRVPAPVADALAMSCAATLGTAPLLAFHFEQLSVVSLPANAIAAPAIAPVMWLGMLAAAVGQLAPALALPLNLLNAFLLGFVGAVARTAAELPYAMVAVSLPGPQALVGAYLLVAGVVVLLRRRGP